MGSMPRYFKAMSGGEKYFSLFFPWNVIAQEMEGWSIVEQGKYSRKQIIIQIN